MSKRPMDRDHLLKYWAFFLRHAHTVTFDVLWLLIGFTGLTIESIYYGWYHWRVSALQVLILLMVVLTGLVVI